jgi:isoleucyl-tRNA synthetase
MEEIDRWVMRELDSIIAAVWKAYEAYEFHTVYHTLYNFCTVTLSARYFDIIKDRLYTFAPQNRARRSAQTALYRIADSLARMLAPILVFTADEIWENLPGESREASVHLTKLPHAAEVSFAEAKLLWDRIFSFRDIVLARLEESRVEKLIGSSLEAKVTITASGVAFEALNSLRDQLRYIFIVSQVELHRAEAPSGLAQETFRVVVTKAEGEKCERCWNYSTRVGESQKYSTVCERCLAALDEIFS